MWYVVQDYTRLYNFDRAFQLVRVLYPHRNFLSVPVTPPNRLSVLSLNAASDILLCCQILTYATLPFQYDLPAASPIRNELYYSLSRLSIPEDTGRKLLIPQFSFLFRSRGIWVGGGEYTAVLAESCYDGICKLIVLNIVLYSVADILHFNKNTLSVALKYFNRIKKWLTRYILSRN